MQVSNQCIRRSLVLRWRAPLLAAFAIVVVSAGLCAQVPVTNAFRVEEDWALVVGQPDADYNGPQVTCTLSPSNMQTDYCAFDLNYHTQPDYSAGGLQLHTWDPANPVAVANSAQCGVMKTLGETVTWTQTMAWTANVVTYRVLNGQSQTWGTFGEPNGPLSLTQTTSLANLNSYDPNVSVANSGVSFASNLVTSLTLKAVRWYDVNGTLIKQVTTPQVVYPKP